MKGFITSSGLILSLSAFVHALVPGALSPPAPPVDVCAPTCPSTNTLLWNQYHDSAAGGSCDEPTLLSFNIHQLLDDPSSHVTISACAFDGSIAVDTVCDQSSAISIPAEISYLTFGSAADTSKIVPSLQALTAFLGSAPCTKDDRETIISVRLGATVASVYVGGLVSHDSAAKAITSWAKSGLSGKSSALQYCSGSSSKNTLGVYIDTTGDWTKVQAALQSWDAGSCISGADKSSSQLTTLALLAPTVELTNLISRRAVPVPQSNGTCATYYTQSGDSCSAIATMFGITPAQIESFNTGPTQTWGWNGCGLLANSFAMCVSTGDPPLPVPLTGAQCGPRKPGTVAPASTVGTLAGLNPCPNNACCNVNGFCGTDDQHCISNATSTNPGSSGGNIYACVQNCGLEITNTGTVPASQVHIGYFASYAGDRQCLHMLPCNINPNVYTHAFYGFVGFDSNFVFDVTSVQSNKNPDIFTQFVALNNGVKKVASFGGAGGVKSSVWRSALSDANRPRFVTALVAFLTLNNLDGLDFDWEYPCTDDAGNPDLASFCPSDADNYAQLMIDVRAALDTAFPLVHKTISVAVPVSYFFQDTLNFAKMNQGVDWFIYEDYDQYAYNPASWGKQFQQ
jgi:hypothetical protein